MFDLRNRYRHWRFKNTALLALSLLVLFLVLDSEPVHNALQLFAQLGYVGAFIAGALFVSTFTVGPAAVLLYFVADTQDVLYVALYAGVGAVLGDYILFRLLKDRVFDEVKPVFMKFGGSHLSRLFATPYFGWLAPVMGALIIASPLPDEVGIGLLGSSRVKTWQFIILSFTLNSIGIFMVITTARLI
jgi:membrane protein YqaA with SNARE-associated domain